MTSKELPVPDPHRQAVPGPQSKGGQDASWAWSSDSDEGGATLPASRGRSRTLTRSGSPLSTSPSQACSQSRSPGSTWTWHGHLMTCGAWWFASGNCHHLLLLTCSAVISFPHLLHFQEADSTLGASERIHASASSQAWEMLLLLFQTPYIRNVTRSTFKETLYKIQCWPGIAWLRWKSQALWKSRRCNGRIRSQSTF